MRTYNLIKTNEAHNQFLGKHLRISLLNTILCNDLTIGWQNSNPLSHPNATRMPQARQARASGENLNYVTLAPQARPSGKILNYLLSHWSDILLNKHW